MEPVYLLSCIPAVLLTLEELQKCNGGKNLSHFAAAWQGQSTYSVPCRQLPVHGEAGKDTGLLCPLVIIYNTIQI